MKSRCDDATRKVVGLLGKLAQENERKFGERCKGCVV